MSNHGDQYRSKAVAKWTPRIRVRADRFDRGKIARWTIADGARFLVQKFMFMKI